MVEFSNPLQVHLVEDSPIIRRLLVSTIEWSGGELVGYSAGAQIRPRHLPISAVWQASVVTGIAREVLVEFMFGPSWGAERMSEPLGRRFSLVATR